MKGLKGKRMLKRASALIMAGLILGTGMSMPISASAEEGVKVLYYETFDDGKDTITNNYTNVNGNYVKYCDGATVTAKQLQNTISSEMDGNKGIGGRSGAWNYEAFRLEFDKELSSGVVTYSYDISRLGRDKNDKGGNLQYCYNIMNHKGDEQAYLLYQSADGKSNIYGPAGNLGGWGDANNNNGSYNLNQKYSICQVLDFNGKKCYTYIDGMLLNTQNIGKKYIKDIYFGLSETAAYFDNFKITYSDKLYMNVESAKLNVSANKAEVMFTDGIDDTTLPREGYGIIDLESGTEYEATAKIGASMRLDVSAEGLAMKDGGMYMVKLPSITGKGGEKTGETLNVANNGNGNVISDFTLTDSEGATHKNAGKIPADVKELTFTFPTADAAAAAEFSFSGGSLTKTVEGKNVNVTLDKYLTGESDYTLDVTGLDKEYSIALSTKAGGVKVANCKYYVGETEIDSLDGVANGTKVKMVLNAVKTVATEKKVLSAYSLYNGKTLKGFNYEEKTMAAADDTAKFEFEITLTSATDAAIKGFLKGELGTVNPLGKIYSIN